MAAEAPSDMGIEDAVDVPFGDSIVGSVLAGRYEITRQIGQGGMGAVYEATHKLIGKRVAVKVLLDKYAERDQIVARLEQEARLASSIGHEHIIDITDFGETEDGMVYMVMEYLQGHSLAEEIERGPIELRRCLRIALQVALGLGRAHELGVVHRDIKPGNIFLTRRRLDRDFVKVLDFGVARIEQDSRITGQNMIVGTPEYISPEQIRAGAARPSGDLYSLGCVMFEMLTGKIPFEGKTTVLLVKHINDAPERPSNLKPEIPPEIDRLVLKLLQKKPEDRHRDAYHLVEDLQRLLDTLPGTEQTSRARGTSPRQSSAPINLEPRPEEEDWARTVRLYRELLRETGGNGADADWLPDAIFAIEERIAETRALRKRLELAAENATAQEEEVRGPRRQIGFALDELAQDDSRIGRQILEIVQQMEPAQSKLDAAMHAVLSAVHTTAMSLKAGQLIDESEQARVREMERAASELALARDEVSALQQRLSRKKAERRDLRYQIVELKRKLDQLNSASTLDMEIWHEEVHRLSTQIQQRLEDIAPIARRIAAHFAGFPELRDRLGRDHAPVTVSEAS
jgi:serine/threonine-protein kinase